MRVFPTWNDLMDFTGGKWLTIPEDEQTAVVEKCSVELERTARQKAWEQLCPPAYRDTDPKRLPLVERFNQVQKWEYGPKGLLLIGTTRRGKTRSAWKLLERLHYEDRKILAFCPMDLKLQVAKAWQDTETAELWIRRLRHTDALFFDDLDTIKFTEAVEETIFDVFESRPMHGKPVIVTLNQSGTDLARRMNANGRGPKIVERMRESCHVINFG